MSIRRWINITESRAELLLPPLVRARRAAVSFDGRVVQGVPWDAASDNLWRRHGDPEATCRYEEWKPEYGIDDFILTEFAAGYCGSLAATIHARTGWAIIDELDEINLREVHPDGSVITDGGSAHTYVLNPNGQAVDIYGVHPTMWARTKWSGTKGPTGILYAPQPGHHNEGDEWANQLLDLFPSHFGL